MKSKKPKRNRKQRRDAGRCLVRMGEDRFSAYLHEREDRLGTTAKAFPRVSIWVIMLVILALVAALAIAYSLGSTMH